MITRQFPAPASARLVRVPSRALHGLALFASAMVEAIAVFAAARDLLALSDARLADQGLRRRDIGRHAMGLPRDPD